MLSLAMKNLSIIIAIVLFEFSIESFFCNGIDQLKKVLPNKDLDSLNIFNVMTYGAKGTGKTDDTMAFQAAWQAACKVQGSNLLVPSNYVFYVKPITFVGSNCAPNITFQIDGNITAFPSSDAAWNSNPQEWIMFHYCKGITFQGKGIIDGQGATWWNFVSREDNFDGYMLQNEKLQGNMARIRPNAVTFSQCTDVTVTGVTITNSPFKHLIIFGCTGVKIFGMYVSSPGDSPNTDGISLSRTQHVVISNVNLACGDDCIAILGECSDIQISSVNCGPGHGISIGSLGRNGIKEMVSNINIRDCIIKNTSNGVRIKTWQGGSGVVQQVNFTNIQVSEVGMPIVIDQYYCDAGPSGCPNKTSALAVSGITYNIVRGTYTRQPVYFACSDSYPCRGINISGINLTPTGRPRSNIPFCWKAAGVVFTPTIPPITCLLRG